MIVQAYWVECFEARVAVVRLEKPHLSTTDARMMVLKEACVVLNWKEKDLRNRMYSFRLPLTECIIDTHVGQSGAVTKKSKIQAVGPA